MAFTQSDLVALEAAIKTGAKRVQYASGSVEYHSLREMLDLRDLMLREIDDGSGTNPAPAVIFAGRLT